MRLLFILAFGLLAVGLVCKSVLFASEIVYKDKETDFSKLLTDTVWKIGLVCLAISSFSWSVIVLKMLFSLLTTFN
jgi:hypothetical protein